MQKVGEQAVWDWINQGLKLKHEMIEYNWEFRNDVCTECTNELKKKLLCHTVNNFRGNIQETHCKKLVKARTKKFEKKIGGFLNLHPLCNRN